MKRGVWFPFDYESVRTRIRRWRFSHRMFVATLLAIGLPFLASAPLFAQGTAGRIQGTVTDQSGGVIAGATVIVTDVDRNVPRTLMTDSAGAYVAPNLLPGNYKVRAEAKGFKAFERTGIILEVNAEIRVDLTMQPGAVSQTITVSEAVPLVETTNAELGATLQSAIIEDIPLNGRNFENLLQLNPGVTIYPGGAGMTQSANGLRPRDNVYMVNGINATDPWMGQSVFNAVMAAGDAGTIMPMDAIDEFKTEQNPRAEYGWRPGAIVNVGVKSGTNALHGSAYAYGRDTVFDARNFFNPTYGANPTKQPVELEQFGGTLGGPIKKDKLFYFVNFESQRYGIGNPNFVRTPTQTELETACTNAGAAATALSKSLAGFTSGCLPDPSKLTTDPSGLQFQGLFPVNTAGSIGTDLISNNVVNGGLGKVNYHLNDKNQLEGMYFISQGNTTSVDSPPSQVSTAWISAQHARSQAASGDWVYTPTSTTVNEVRFGYSHYYQTFFGTDTKQDPANYNFNGQTYHFPTGINPVGPGGVSYGGAPGIRFKGGYYANSGNDGIGIGWPKIIGPDGVLEFLDHVSVIKGKHAFKFGGEFIYDSSTEDETSNAKGVLRFSSLGNFFKGNLNQARVFLGDPIRTLYNYNYAAFLQDDWRVTPRLTVNLGVRYELATVVHDKNGQMGNFDPILGLVQTNNPYNGDHNNFSPRIGFAWDIFGKGKTVLRGAGGIIYENYGFDVMNGEGNLLGLRTFPTGLPLFNAGSPTAQPINGNIQLQSLTFGAGSPPLSLISSAWQNFNPTGGACQQQTSAQFPGGNCLLSGVSTPACGDGINQPPGYSAPPGPCEIYGVDRNLRTPYVNEWSLDLQHAITNNLSIDIAYVGNHGSKLLGKLDLNQPAPGAGWTSAAKTACINSATDPMPFDNCAADSGAEQLAEPFTAPCAFGVTQGAVPNGTGGPFNPTNSCLSYLSYITIIKNIYESNYHGMEVTLTGRNYHGLSFTAGYTYSHAFGDASDQGTAANFPVPTNSYGDIRKQLYASTDFDIRHRFTLSLDYAIPGKKGFGQMLEGWSVNTIVIVTSGLPWGASDQSDDFSGTNVINSNAQSFGEPWNFYGNTNDFAPIHGWTDTNCFDPVNPTHCGWTSGAGGVPSSFDVTSTGAAVMQKCVAADNAHFSGDQLQLALASLAAVGCYAAGNSVMVPPPFGSYGNMKLNLFRDAGFKNWDLSVTKAFAFHERFKAEFRVEGFNILNHVNWSNPSGGPGGSIQDPSGQPFGFVGLTPDSYSSNPQIGSGGERALQLGLKLSW